MRHKLQLLVVFFLLSLSLWRNVLLQLRWSGAIVGCFSLPLPEKQREGWRLHPSRHLPCSSWPWSQGGCHNWGDPRGSWDLWISPQLRPPCRCLLFPFLFAVRSPLLVGSLWDFGYVSYPACWGDECFIRAVYVVVRSVLLPVQMEMHGVFPRWVPASFLAEEQGSCSQHGLCWSSEVGCCSEERTTTVGYRFIAVVYKYLMGTWGAKTSDCYLLRLPVETVLLYHFLWAY